MLIALVCILWWGLVIGNANAADVMPEAVHVAPKLLARGALPERQFGITALDAATDNCWLRAATLYGVNAHVLRAIAEVESGLRAGAINHNRNGSLDIGLMQINTAWLPTLARHGIAREDLFDPCINVHVGAWILRQNNQKFGATSWQAVGAYNARTDAKRLAYARKVHRRLRVVAR